MLTASKTITAYPTFQAATPTGSFGIDYYPAEVLLLDDEEGFTFDELRSVLQSREEHKNGELVPEEEVFAFLNS